ncbi:hypothetical protein HAZT_HAZT001906 [Hyalella azteca]|uniref:PUM-HD domain-containing protein n=1 Tax=Hyalella azteca TaxID=294128 RepID=A0A6A0H3H5_HYAAZ|nr:hypothetical protein HAZT_HAZT001906 [Hyalella azteca]
MVIIEHIEKTCTYICIEDDIDLSESSSGVDQKNKTKKFGFNGPSRNGPYGKFGGKGKDPQGKPDWREVRAETKSRKKKRKQRSVGGEELYTSFMKAIKLWEELRHTDCKKDRRLELCRQVTNLFIGNVKVWIKQASGIRMAEHLITHGDADIRQRLFDEICSKEQILETMKDSHSHHFLLKILKHGSKNQRDLIFAAMEGQVVRLSKHTYASNVIQLAYSDFATSDQRSKMMQEFFGPRFRYFKEEGVKTLGDILEKHPSKKKEVMEDLKKGLQMIMHKGIFNSTLILGLLREYMVHCDDQVDFNLVIESVEDGLLRVVHTKDGARIAMMCLWRGSAKQRKTIIKSFKGHMIEVATWEHSYMVLLAALDCVEDTKFLHKAVLEVLMAEKEKLLQSEYGTRVFRYMVLGRNATYVHPDILKVLESGDVCSQNKKPRDLCRREILQYISGPLLQALTDNLPRWCRDAHWTLFLGAAIHVLPEAGLKCAAMTSLAQHCAAPVPEDAKPLMDLAPFSKMLSFLVGKDAENKKNKMPLFTLILIKHAGETIASWLKCNRGCFLMVKAIETEVKRVMAAVRDHVAPHTDAIDKIKSSAKGAELLLEKLKLTDGVEASEDEEEKTGIEAYETEKFGKTKKYHGKVLENDYNDSKDDHSDVETDVHDEKMEDEDGVGEEETDEEDE